MPTCRYDCLDVKTPADPADADIVKTPWNIGTRFWTGVFDVVLFDIPHSAFQRSIRTSQAEAGSGTVVTHIDTVLKRSLSDLMSGDSGCVIQIGQTVTLICRATTTAASE